MHGDYDGLVGDCSEFAPVRQLAKIFVFEDVSYGYVDEAKPGINCPPDYFTTLEGDDIEKLT
jgi:hypothetical protein